MSLNHVLAGTPVPLAVTFEAAAVVADLSVGGSVAVAGDMKVSGDMTVMGTLNSAEPLIELNKMGASAEAIGVYALRENPPGPDVYTGFVRDEGSGTWYLFDGSATAPPAADLSQLGEMEAKSLVLSSLLNVQGDATVEGNLGAGNVYTGAVVASSVESATLSTSAAAVVVNDSATNQAGIGLYAPITPLAPGPTYYAGLMRQAGDDAKWHLTDGVTIPPPGDLSSSHGSLEVDTLTCRVLNRVDELKVDDPLFEVNAAAVDDSMAVGFYAQQIPAGPVYFTGLVREPASKNWYLIDNSPLEPPNPGAYANQGHLTVGQLDASGLINGAGNVYGDLLLGTGSGNMARFPPGADGTLFQSVGGSPTWFTPSGGGYLPLGGGTMSDDINMGGNSLTSAPFLDNAAGTVEIAPNAAALSISQPGVISAVLGGLSVASTINGAGSASGDLLVGTGANSMATLSPGADGSSLQMSGGAATWVTPSGGGYLPLGGGTMSGPIDLGGNSLTTVGTVDNSGGIQFIGPNALGLSISQLGVTTNVRGGLSVAATVNGAGIGLGDLLVGSGAGSMQRLAPGGNGTLLQMTGGGPAWTPFSIGQSYGYGATFAVSGFARANGDASDAADAAEVVGDRQPVLGAGAVRGIGYSTTSGDNTTQYQITKNGGLVSVVTGTGAAGFGAVFVAVAAGDVLACGYNGVGTAPGASTLGLLVS
jgi:hypothetical protein